MLCIALYWNIIRALIRAGSCGIYSDSFFVSFLNTAFKHCFQFCGMALRIP